MQLTALDDICHEIRCMAKSHSIPLRLNVDEDAGVVRIVSGSATALSQAKNGLASIDELALDAAEHHPYWSLLYSCVQIAGIILDRWDSEITQAEQSEIKWSAIEIQRKIQQIIDTGSLQEAGS